MGEELDSTGSLHSTKSEAIDRQCDAVVVSCDGVPFNAHKQLLCDASEVFEAFFAERWKSPENAPKKYESKNIDSECLQYIMDDIYGKEPKVPEDMLLPVLQAARFLLLKSDRLHEYCYRVMTREPFAVIDHKLFYPMITSNSALVDSILEADLLLTNESQLRRIFFSWPSDDLGRVDAAKKRLKALCRRSRDVVYMYDRSSGMIIGFTGNRCFEWFERESLSFPEDVQHIAITDSAVLYACSDEIKTLDRNSERTLYVERSELKWPPLLRRYGKITVWSEDNRRKIRVRWSDSNRRKSDTVVFLRSPATIVRNFATPDSEPNDRLVVIATQNGIWKVLSFNLIFLGSKPDEFMDLECPLKRIDGAAVLNGAIYVLGNETMGAASDKLLVYREQSRRWSALRDRDFENEVRAFFPLNGRLYVVCNDRDVCEVYEPSIDRWMLTHDFYRMRDITGYSMMSRSDF